MANNNDWPSFEKPKPKAPNLGHFYCKLRLDKRTIVMVRSEASYNDWMTKFPKAERMDLNA